MRIVGSATPLAAAVPRLGCARRSAGDTTGGWRPRLGVAALALLLAAAGCTGGPDRQPNLIAAIPDGTIDAPAASRPAARQADFQGVRAAADVRRIADWVVDSTDHGGLPFAIVDKRQARVYVFDARGRLRGAAPVLLGLARGDDSVPGIGERAMADIRRDERTTPAGRFVAEFGRNLGGEDILWVDYDAAVSMHRVRATRPAERRLQRLASASAWDNRISYGCINLPAAFYDEVLRPAFAVGRGIVYVLPETHPAQALFGSYDVDARARRYAGTVPAGADALLRH